MGGMMAAALSRLFKENEIVLQAARAAGALVSGRPTYLERLTSTNVGAATELTLQWRVTFQTMQDLEDFNSAMRALVECAEEE